MANFKKLGSRKYSQSDLRRMMIDQKLKLENSKKSSERVDSPLAKYDTLDNLLCIICRSGIKSANVWKVHINSKQHKQKVEMAKQLRNEILSTSTSNSNIYSDKHKSSRIEKDLNFLVLNKTINSLYNGAEPKCLQDCVTAADDKLPEKFFDDPIKDARIRKADSKDPQDEEWERFQREIKEQTTMSSAIVAGEQDENAVIRQIEEIDEQMERWAKVIDLEEKKDEVLQRTRQNHAEHSKVYLTDYYSTEESDEFDEFSDWRSKKF